ncbi:MAG: hypothetical protein KBF88_09305 [Polyangiaceae bacterium]|nr:hypothetical protein [Polyangiaceae bacterium]
MRGRSLVLACMTGGSLALLGAGTITACAPPPPIFVHQGKVGLRSEAELGKILTHTRFPERARNGLAEGWAAIRSDADWDLYFQEVPRSDRPPAPSIDYKTTMMVVGYSRDPELSDLVVKKVVHANTGIHVYAEKSLFGEGCKKPKAPKRKKGEPPPPVGTIEIATFPRFDEAVHLHVDPVRGFACDVEMISGELICKKVGSADTAARVTASLGDKIDCMGPEAARGVFDRSWQFQKQPKGSLARFTVLPEAMHAVFPIDVLGTYDVELDVFGDRGKQGEYRAIIEVPPPNDLFYVQTYWAGVDRRDDADTYPRIELRAIEASPEKGKPAKMCATDGQKGPHCSITKVRATTLTRLSSDVPTRHFYGVKYIDDRYAGMAYICVKTFFRNKETSERCDEAPRKAGSVWLAGILNESVGAFESEVEFSDTDAGADAGTVSRPNAAPTGQWSTSW